MGKAISRAERVMNKVIKRPVRSAGVSAQAPRVTVDLADLFRSLKRAAFDTYRPELHYMRGPGPKWHAKHDPVPVDFVGAPSLVRVRAKG
jgi:hypothetical protein